jgi:hypothetical protein
VLTLYRASSHVALFCPAQAFAPGMCDLATGELLDAGARERVAALVAALADFTRRLAPR